MNFYKDFDFKEARKLIKLALNEDLSKGDITSNLLIPNQTHSKAALSVKENGIIAGLEIFKLVFKMIDRNIHIEFFKRDGDGVFKGDLLAHILGNTRSLLMGERLSLNIIQRMSGIATLTKYFLNKLNNKKIKIIDTRKTTPNFRLFEKLAVKIGGGENHRFGLFDMILIKDNHIQANDGIEKILKILKIRKKKIKQKIEIEVKTVSELQKVIKYGKEIIDRVMLDNFDIKELKKALKLNSGFFEIEVSGGINKYNVSNYGRLKGIDYISIGSLTHSYKSLDIALNFIT